MKILDMSAGNRAIWFNKRHPDCLYVDIRAEVNPDLVCDMREGHPAIHNNTYNLIIFDPPHVNFGANANMTKTYGHHTSAEIRDIIRGSAYQAWICGKPGSLMAFKWNDHDQSFKSVLALMDDWWEPLFGTTTSTRTRHKGKTNTTTQWVMLKRRDAILNREQEKQP